MANRRLSTSILLALLARLGHHRDIFFAPNGLVPQDKLLGKGSRLQLVAYCGKVERLGALAMREEFAGSENWICVQCDASLVPSKSKLGYLNKEFETELMCCPVCDKAFIGEPLALGKILEVELSLEDK